MKERNAMQDEKTRTIASAAQEWRGPAAGVPAAAEANSAQGQGGNEGVRLAQLQKEIVIATWKLQQEQTNSANIQIP